MRHLSISLKLILTIGTAVVAGAILVALLLSQLDSMATTHAGVMEGEVHQIDAARVIQVEFKKQVQEWKDILLRGKDPEALKKHTDKFTAQDSSVEEKAQTLIHDISTATVRDHVAQFASNHREMSAKYHVALQTFINDPAKEPATADKMVKGLDRAATDAIDGVVAELNTRITTLTTANAAHVAAERQKVLTVAFIVLLLVLGFSTMIARDIVGAQRAIVRGLESIAAGQLETRLDDSRRDEMGKIVVALNAAIESWRRKDHENAAATVAREREQTEGLQTGFQTILTAVSAAKAGDLTRDIDTRGKPPIVSEVGGLLGDFIESLRTRIATIDEHAGQLAAASEELSTTAQDLSAASVQTATQTGAAQTTVAEMGTSVTTVSASASQMTDAIRDITVNAQQACKVASEAVVMVEDANQTMARLGSSSKEIGEVVKVITSIAAQTNLLALNATIEAARAGEAGRGFAIVAREVKDLAAETAKATENIDQRIRAIQTDTIRAVKAIASVKTVIDNVNNFSSTIAAAVEEHTSITTEVRRTLTWVADGTSKLGGNVSSVSQAAEATTSGARNTQGAADAIATMASEMKSLVSQFRLVKHPGEGHRVQELRAPVVQSTNGHGQSNGRVNGYGTARRAS